VYAEPYKKIPRYKGGQFICPDDQHPFHSDRGRYAGSMGKGGTMAVCNKREYMKIRGTSSVSPCGGGEKRAAQEGEARRRCLVEKKT